MFYNQYKNSSHSFSFSTEGEGGRWAGAGSCQPPFLLKIDKLFTGQETISQHNSQKWTESSTLSFKANLNMPFEDTRLVADR